MRLRIKQGRIIDPLNRIDQIGDVCLADGRIVACPDPASDFQPDREIDANDKLVIPGVIDLCARFREPGEEYKATIASEAGAAAAGGVTGVCQPPDTTPVIDTPAVVELLNNRTEQVDRTRLYPLGAMTLGLGGERLAEMAALATAGCVGVSNGREPITNTELLRRALEYAVDCNLPVFLFCEDPHLRNRGVVHEGTQAARLGLPGIPHSAETIAVNRALLLIEEIGVRSHFCQISSARTVQMIATARDAGLPVTADVAVCNMLLTDTDIATFDANYHLRPPLRAESDRLALIDALAAGVIDAVCSDHQPHDDDAKAAPFGAAAAGASTIEHLLPLMLELATGARLDLMAVIAALTINPARILGLDGGHLSPAAPADLVIIDPEKSTTINRDDFFSAGRNSPFLGRTLVATVSHTLLAGRPVFPEVIPP